MTKDGNAGRKDGQENSSNGRSHKRNERRPPTKASKAILKLRPPPASEWTTSVKLEDAIGNEVKEHLDNWREGDNGRILIDMLVKSISICNKYSLYNGDDGWKAVVQAVRRALTGTREKELDKLINDTNDWGRGGAKKHKRTVQELCIKKAISEDKIRLKILNVLLRRSCPCVFFVAHAICTLHVLRNKTIVSAALNKIKRSFYVLTVLLFRSLCSRVFAK